MAHNDTPYLTGGFRFGKTVGGQTSIQLEGPVGFIESTYFPERGALFFARSSTQWETITHLIRDTPDSWTHIGWSGDAEYRSGGRWVRMSEAPVAEEHHFVRTEHKWANLNGRWNLAGSSPRSGSSVASELCQAAIDWWDDRGKLRLEPTESPQIYDFCAAFPTLSARRLPDGPIWNIIYSTETAEWIYDAKKKWVFHKKIDYRDRASTANMERRLAEAWTQYRRTLASSSANSRHNADVKNLTAIAQLFQHGAEFPLILALIPELLNEASSKNMNFDDLSRYSAVNAIAANSKNEDPSGHLMFVQNDVARWERSRSRWSPVDRKPIPRSIEEIPLDDLSRAALHLSADLSQKTFWFDESPRMWIISDMNPDDFGNYPIRDVVRGTLDTSGTGWTLAGGNPFQWSWTSIPELDIHHLLPMHAFDQNSYATTRCIEVDKAFEVSLEEFWTQVISHEIDYDYYPGWLDFLEWVRDYG